MASSANEIAILLPRKILACLTQAKQNFLSGSQADSPTEVQRGAPGTDMEDVELRVLARAAAEAEQLAYLAFAIVHIRDRNMPITGGLFSTVLYGSERVWIGSYNELVESRYERDFAVAPRAWVNPGLTAIVQLVPEDHPRFDQSFKAQGLYELLNGSEMAGK